MQIFELHFNPKLKEDRIFDSFAYEAANIYERKLGNLFIVTELKNALPSDSKLLNTLAQSIKEKYYTLSFKSPEKAVLESLKKGNDFLAGEIKKENINWLGNLNIAVISLKDFNLIFTKTGELKLFLLRGSQIIDIGKNLDAAEIDPYPLKFFSNIVSGKLMEEDIILVLTKEIFEFFKKENLLTKLATTGPFNGSKLKAILPAELFSRGEGSKISGLCFLVFLGQSEDLPEKRRQVYLPKKEKFKAFLQKVKAIKKFFSNIINIAKIPIKIPKIKNILKIKKKTTAKITVKVKSQESRKAEFKPFKFSFPKISFKNPQQQKKIIIIAIFLTLLLLGSLMFK